MQPFFGADRLWDMRLILITSLSLVSVYTSAQTSVLFLGNSYTAFNNLPQITTDVAASAGFEMTTGANTPGGFTLSGHSNNVTSQQLIAEGTWDYVVLQEQSQMPSFPTWQVETECFPFAQALNDLILDANPCAETVFYMTWGRENGDAQNCPNWPPVCTYEGMDDLLFDRYMQMASDNQGVVSPVGRVWRYLRENAPQLDLYSGDGSHPSYAGSYAAAVTFFSVIMRADPELVTFNGSLSASDAQTIRNAVQLVVFNNLEQWLVGLYDPMASFTYQPVSSTQIQCTSTSVNAEGAVFQWSSDAAEASGEVVTLDFPGPGSYDVTLTITTPCSSSIITQEVVVGEVGIRTPVHEVVVVYPNPSSGVVNIRRPDSWRGVPIRITDASGRVIAETMDDSIFLSPGVYSVGGVRVVVE